MRRSLQLRLLGLSIGVAALAVSATALLATHGTGEEPAGEPLLETDAEIRAALATYANEHRDWTGVEPLVRDLAERTGRRIALVTPDGEPVVDSAALLGEDPADLPRAPSARIDATALPSPEVTLLPVIVVRTPGRDASLSFYVWQLTEQERRQRQALADEAAECLRRDDAPPVPRHRDHISDGASGAASPAFPCLPRAVLAPSAAGREVARLTAERTAACLDEHGVAYEIGTAESGGPAVRPASEVARSPVWTECAEAARVAAKRPFVAEPADLYLGESDRFDPFSAGGSGRTAVTVAAVLFAAIAVTVLVGRRLVRPIHALTAAAGRMAAGDRTARVASRGDDEVARLASAFNSMATAIEVADRQRKTLVGDVAHELRTPLANVLSHLEAAKDGLVALDGELVRSLIEESELLERLVADLQDLALADAGMLRVHPEERDATDLAAAVVAAHRAKAEESGVDLRLAAAGPVTVHADPARLRQSLGNLVSNAVRHTPPGGRVVVAVRGSADGVADGVVLSVADTGHGIEPEHLSRIFDRFYRADPSRSRVTGGTGLGLAIARHLVAAHGGRLEVTSAPGVGATFTIWLPRHECSSSSGL